MSTTLEIIYPHVVVNAPARAVFDFVADLRNMPAWSIHFCKGMRFEGDGARVQTPHGEVYFAARADAATGVIDWIMGPSKDRATTWPTRVVSLPDGSALFTVTALCDPNGEPAATVERLFADELGMLKSLVEQRHAAAARRGIEPMQIPAQ